MTYYAFTVEGRGQFPLDMLRYDACYPADSDTVSQIDAEDEPGKRRRVRLLTSRDTPPTSDRWSSFGWRVIISDRKR